MKARILSLFILLSIIVFSTPANAMPDIGQAIDNFFYHLTNIISPTDNTITGYSTMSCSLQSCAETCPSFCAVCVCPGGCELTTTTAGDSCGQLTCPADYPYSSCPDECTDGCEQLGSCYRCKEVIEETEEECPSDYPYDSCPEQCSNGCDKKYVSEIGYCFKCKAVSEEPDCRLDDCNAICPQECDICNCPEGCENEEVSGGELCGVAESLVTYAGWSNCGGCGGFCTRSKCHRQGSCYWRRDWTYFTGLCLQCKGATCSSYKDSTECRSDPCKIGHCDWARTSGRRYKCVISGQKGAPSCSSKSTYCKDKYGKHSNRCISRFRLKQWSCDGSGRCRSKYRTCWFGCTNGRCRWS